MDVRLNTLKGAEVSNRMVDVDAEESRAISVETELSNALAAEISRAESAEAGLGQRIDDALSNVDFSEIDSIAEVLNTFYQKVTYSEAIDGTNTTFTPNYLLKSGSESVFLNGILQQDVDDYTTTSSNDMVSSIEFVTAPEVGSKVAIYGVTNTNAGSPYDPSV